MHSNFSKHIILVNKVQSLEGGFTIYFTFRDFTSEIAQTVYFTQETKRDETKKY